MQAVIAHGCASYKSSPPNHEPSQTYLVAILEKNPVGGRRLISLLRVQRLPGLEASAENNPEGWQAATIGCLAERSRSRLIVFRGGRDVRPAARDLPQRERRPMVALSRTRWTCFRVTQSQRVVRRNGCRPAERRPKSSSETFSEKARQVPSIRRLRG